jgi:hypothetical protein
MTTDHSARQPDRPYTYEAGTELRIYIYRLSFLEWSAPN